MAEVAATAEPRVVAAPVAERPEANERSTHSVAPSADASYLRAARREAASVVQRHSDGTSPLPAPLRSGVEALSSVSMDDVQVHYGSARPAQLDALAYAQGSDIHVAPGQEAHLPHEAWHVAQQRQGRVDATRQMKGESLNDDSALEAEADRMGARAARVGQDLSVQRATDTMSARVVPARTVATTVDSEVAQRRAKNPRREDSSAYQPDPVAEADVGKEPYHKLTEHHIVPHATLDKAQKKLGDDLDVGQFLPKPGEITVRMMTNLKSGWSVKWVDDFNKANPDHPVGMDELAETAAARLIPWLQDNSTETAVKRLDVDAVTKGLQADDDMDDVWAAAFIEWFPGNIVRGPTNRKYDQSDGNALDKELIHLLRTVRGDAAHADAAEELMAACTAFVKTPADQALRTRAADAFTALNQFAYTPYDPAEWVSFAAQGAATPTPLVTDTEMMVPGFAGNQ